MALFIDDLACGIDDLTDQDSGLLEVAEGSGINVNTKIRLAQDEIESELELWLQKGRSESFLPGGQRLRGGPGGCDDATETLARVSLARNGVPRLILQPIGGQVSGEVAGVCEAEPGCQGRAARRGTGDGERPAATAFATSADNGNRPAKWRVVLCERGLGGREWTGERRFGGGVTPG